MVNPPLESILEDQPYVNGFEISNADFDTWKKVHLEEKSLGPHTTRWYNHIKSFSTEKIRSDQSNMSSDVLTKNLLQTLDDTNAELNSIEFAAANSVEHQKVIGAIKSLLSHDDLISTKDVTEKRLELTEEGKDMAANGSFEYRVYQAVGEEGTLQSDIMKQPFGKVGVSKALQLQWIAIDKTGGNVRLNRKVESVVDTVASDLKKISAGESLADKEKNDLKKRKLIAETTVKGLVISKGLKFTKELSKPELDLSSEMIANGSWKTKNFKKYNFEAMGIPPPCGHLHPLLKVRSEFRLIFLSMGFSEMPTNRYVESSFWNFDALFQPQQHPARDSHDTFFISDPAISTQFPMDYLEKVKTVHSKGGFGSLGYNYDWKIEEAQKNVLRTHTTAVSARVLYQLAQEKEFRPAKMFSIDRVFRNETLDATHLAEFHQVEGVIAERNLSLAHLIGIFTEFFKKLGIENLRFKPTYNPYTEPSMEIFAYHAGLKKWVEIGNSGMFRPEMLLPMGLPPDVNVAGYGLSLERPTMIRYGIDNIRDMFGPKIDLSMIYNGPICRLDKK